MTDPSKSTTVLPDSGSPGSAEHDGSAAPDVPAVPGLRFVTRGVTSTEAAAVSAVLHGLVREESDNLHQAPARGQSAWHRSQRGVRVPLTPGRGHWRGFSA